MERDTLAGYCRDALRSGRREVWRNEFDTLDPMFNDEGLYERTHDVVALTWKHEDGSADGTWHRMSFAVPRGASTATMAAWFEDVGRTGGTHVRVCAYRDHCLECNARDRSSCCQTVVVGDVKVWTDDERLHADVTFLTRSYDAALDRMAQ